MNHLATNLKRLRADSGRSQHDVALAMDIKRSNYSSYETGNAEPPLDVLIRMADHFKVGLDILIGEPLHTLGEFKLMQLRPYITPRVLKYLLPEDTVKA